MTRQPFVYILANRKRGVLYIGVTSNLPTRVWQHRNDLVDGFSRKYRTHRLVHYESIPSMYDAIVREKQLKEWHRAWKIRLIDASNPDWRDLWDEVCR